MTRGSSENMSTLLKQTRPALQSFILGLLLIELLIIFGKIAWTVDMNILRGQEKLKSEFIWTIL